METNIPQNISRLEPLIGSAGITALRKKTVAIVGLGGVGSWAAEAICRSGVGKVIVIDGDKAEESNLNRQLFSTTNTIGQSKAHAAEERLRLVNPNASVTAIDIFIEESNMSMLDEYELDCVVDAIDSVPSKIALLRYCYRRGIRVVSSMGAGGKVDPHQIKAADISKTHGCMLAKKVRKLLKGEGITKGIQTVFSAEQGVKPTASMAREQQPPIGSAVWVTGAFGLFLAKEVIVSLLDKAE